MISLNSRMLIIVALLVLSGVCHSQTAESNASPMTMQNITLGVISTKLEESKEFYLEHLDFEVVFENDWYIHMRAKSEPRFQVAFLQPNHPTQPPVFKAAFKGEGLFYTLEVANVDALFNRLKAAGIRIEFPLTDEEWGERHFAVLDPNGVALNISQPISSIDPEYRKDFKIEQTSAP